VNEMADHYWKSMWDPSETEWSFLAQRRKDLQRMYDNSQIALVDNSNRLEYYIGLQDDVEEQLQVCPTSTVLRLEQTTLRTKIAATEKKIDFYRKRGDHAKTLLQSRYGAPTNNERSEGT